MGNRLKRDPVYGAWSSSTGRGLGRMDVLETHSKNPRLARPTQSHFARRSHQNNEPQTVTVKAIMPM